MELHTGVNNTQEYIVSDKLISITTTEPASGKMGEATAVNRFQLWVHSTNKL